MTRSTHEKAVHSARIPVLAVVLCLFGVARTVCGQSLEAQQVTEGGEVRSHWHGGPFFEYRRAVGPTPAGGTAEERLRTFWAFRPFYSQLRSPDVTTRDIVWPLVTSHRNQDHLWWRAFFLAYGDARDGVDDSWSFNLLPLVFCGNDRQEGDYWGIFPIYGSHPHFLLMDHWRFGLWPLWMDYDVKAIHHGAILWPFLTWKENGTGTVGVWPIFSHARLRESDHWYALWPLATWAHYDEDRDTAGAGHSWMLWPLYGTVSRAREEQHLVLPPFFSHTHTPHVTRWRLPWPFVDVEHGSKRDRISVWPLYEQVEGFSFVGQAPEERTYRILWKLVEDTELETETTQETHFSFFPFWTSECRYEKSMNGTRHEVASYRRFWPFWSSSTQNGYAKSRVLELIPIRHAEGFDRNWAPFWTFWSSSSEPNGPVRHSVLWNLITWTSE